MKKIVLTLALAATTLCSYAQKSGIIAGFSYGKLGKHTSLFKKQRLCYHTIYSDYK